MTSTENIKSALPAEQLVWGAKAIGEILGRSEKAAFHMLEAGRVPGAKKVAGRWGLNLKIFMAAFEAA